MPADKQQLNTTLPPALVRRIKHRAIDEQLSLSDWIERAMEAHLERQEDAMTGGIELQPMVHVTDMARSVALYEALGATIEHGSRDGDFAMLRLGGARFSLLAHPPNPDQHEGEVELNFESTTPLEEVAARLRDAGFPVPDPTDEGFGRQLQVEAPGGLMLKVNELDRDAYA